MTEFHVGQRVRVSEGVRTWHSSPGTNSIMEGNVGKIARIKGIASYIDSRTDGPGVAYTLSIDRTGNIYPAGMLELIEVDFLRDLEEICNVGKSKGGQNDSLV